MKSLEILPELKAIPVDKETAGLEPRDMLSKVRAMDGGQFAIEVSLATEEVLEGLFEWRNVDDDLTEGFNKAFSRIAEEGASLNERYLEMVARGPQSVERFVSNLKGKVAEIKTEEMLDSRHPHIEWEIAALPNQPGWDIKGTSSDGEDIFVQVKTGTEGYASKVVDAMEDAPNVPFAVSSEIYGAIEESHPELVVRLIDIGSNEELTENVENGLEKLAANHGIDVPDSIGSALPFIDELATGVYLIKDMVGTERELSGVDLSDRKRVHGIRALVFLIKFGVRKVCITAGIGLGGFLGSIVPFFGNFIGAAAGFFVGMFTARKFNSLLESHVEEFATALVGGDSEDLFYWMNKKEIDDLGQSFVATQVA